MRNNSLVQAPELVQRKGGRGGEEEAVLGKMLLPIVSQKIGRAVGNRGVNRLRVKRRFFPF